MAILQETERVLTVTQDTQLFSGTIRENLMFVNPGATEEQVMEALQKASCQNLLIRYMQGLGVFSFFLCVGAMFCIYYNWTEMAKYSFSLSLLTLLASLFISLVEIIKSTNAIELELSDIEGMGDDNILTSLLSK